MLAWLLWFGYALIPALITIVADLSMQTMSILYFVFVLGAIVIKAVYDKATKSPEAV